MTPPFHCGALTGFLSKEFPGPSPGQNTSTGEGLLTAVRESVYWGFAVLLVLLEPHRWSLSLLIYRQDARLLVCQSRDDQPLCLLSCAFPHLYVYQAGVPA